MPNTDATHLENDRSRTWLIGLIALLFAATFLNYAQRFVFTQNTTKIQQAFAEQSLDQGHNQSRNITAYSRAASRFSLGFAFGSLLFGIIADAVSVRWLYPLVVVIWSVAGIMSGTIHTVAGLAASRFVLGLFEAGHWPCALRTTQRAFLPADRTAANGLLQSGASIGAVITPLLVLLVHQVDPTKWRFSFLIVGVVGIPWALVWLWLVKPADMNRAVIQTDEYSNDVGHQHELVEQPLRLIFCSRRWWLLLLTAICINTVWHFIRVWMTDWLENYHGYSHAFTTSFTSVYFLFTFFGALASGALISWLARRGWNVHQARMTTFLAFSLLTCLVVPAALLPTGPILLICLLFVAFGSLGLFPVFYSLSQELSAKHQGKIAGSLGFYTWLTLSGFHEAVGQIVSTRPEMRTTIFCCVGVAPLIAYVALKFGWGTRFTN